MWSVHPLPTNHRKDMHGIILKSLQICTYSDSVQPSWTTAVPILNAQSGGNVTTFLFMTTRTLLWFLTCRSIRKPNKILVTITSSNKQIVAVWPHELSTTATEAWPQHWLCDRPRQSGDTSSEQTKQNPSADNPLLNDHDLQKFIKLPCSKTVITHLIIHIEVRFHILDVEVKRCQWPHRMVLFGLVIIFPHKGLWWNAKTDSNNTVYICHPLLDVRTDVPITRSISDKGA